VRWCALDSVQAASESEIRDSLARQQWGDLDNLDAAIERAVSDVEMPQVRSTLPEDASFRCVVDYIGAYAHWDLPSNEPAYDSYALETVGDYTRTANEISNLA